MLLRQRAPPNPGGCDLDPYLAEAFGPLRLSRGGACRADFALRFSAGFGSHVCFALYAAAEAGPAAEGGPPPPEATESA